MRLIDADETLRLMEFEEYKYEFEENYGYRQAEQFIKLQPTVEAIPLDKPFLKMKYKGYTVYNTEWLKEHIDMEYKLIKGISETMPKVIPIEWIKQWSKQFYKDINGRTYYMGDGYDTIWDMLEEWEKEHEI